MSDVFLLSGISGLSFDSDSLSPFLFLRRTLLIFLSYIFSACWSILLTFCSRKNLQYFSFRIGFFCMAPAQQLGEVSWSLVCTAYCILALIFAVMCLYDIDLFIAFALLFDKILLKNIVLINRLNAPGYQRVQTLVFPRCSNSTKSRVNTSLDR